MASMKDQEVMLISLSEAKRYLQKLQRTELRGLNLWRLRVKVDYSLEKRGIVRAVELVQVEASQSEDENSIGMKLLLGLLKCSNQAISHAAVKALVALSDYLRKVRRKTWHSYLLALWNDAYCWVSCPDPASLKGAHVYGGFFLQSGFSIVEVQAHENACLGATSNTLQTLQESLKGCLKVETEVCKSQVSSKPHLESLEVFLCFLTTNVNPIATSCWRDTTERNHTKSWSCSTAQSLSRELVLGALLRLLCTGTRTASLLCGSNDNQNVSVGAYLEVAQDLIPILRSGALQKHEECTRDSGCLHLYLRHKFLMLMIKLSEWFSSKPLLASACHEALVMYGADLLDVRLAMVTELDDSPFCESWITSTKFDVSASSSVRRLQRRAILLLLRCAHAAHPSEGKGKNYGREHDEIVESEKRRRLYLPSDCGCNIPALMSLRDWVRKQHRQSWSYLPLSKELNYEHICEWVSHLGTAIIQLYLGEDDLLMSVLIDLLDVSCLPKTFTCLEHVTEAVACQAFVKAIQPTRLLVSFLATIDFDHSTVEKLLVSKTSGVSCLSYMMRSLRHTCDALNETSPRAKTDVALESGSILDSRISNEHMSFTKDTQQHTTLGEGQRSEARQVVAATTVENAFSAPSLHLLRSKVASCLRKLKQSIEVSYGKAIFPYNPTPLLGRLDETVKFLAPKEVSPEKVKNLDL